MKFRIESHLKKKLDDVSFLQLKADAEISVKGFKIPDEGLYVPFLTEELAQNIKIKKENEVLTIGGIMRGMIYTIGIDSEFKYKEAYIEFMQAVESNLEEYVLFQGTKYIEEEKLLEGIIYFKALIAINPENENAFLHYSINLLRYAEECLTEQAKLSRLFKQEAKDFLEQLFQVGYDIPLVNYHLGFLAREDKQYRKAEIHWNKALEGSNEEDFKEHVVYLLRSIEDLVMYETGYEAILAGNPQHGLPMLEELEGKYEEWWNLLFFIGLGHRQLGQYEKAIGYFDRVLELKSDQVDAMVEMAICLSGMGDYQDAVDGFLRALEVGGDNHEVLSNLAIAYMEIGDYINAKSCVERSLQLEPNDEITQLCQKRLIELMNE